MTASDAILILTTGGTIDKQYFDALSEYQVVDTAVARLLEVARVTKKFEIAEIVRKDSIDLDDTDRAALVAAARDAAATRIVVTHGTDTMTESAAALAQVTGKTIVMTGALTPARFSESDAAFNLGMAFATAQVAPPGVYIVMNGTVFDAAHVVKDRARGAFVPK
ncbi:asparaginase [Sphingomonas canadensis]|uniref:Asparaginase n=1 Tax=Sphingomonas canadensis TaxID=1219257 RepID=A0ABW3HBC2_9SPHN|nr:asparaginase [Sphingomonas canadensis]MCW3838087.1 asparaginase [Sphingomonas canadensis]